MEKRGRYFICLFFILLPIIVFWGCNNHSSGNQDDPSTPYLVRDINNIGRTADIFVKDTDRDIFLFISVNESAVGVDLWRSDGTPGGTESIKQFSVGTVYDSDSYYTVNNGTLYFLFFSYDTEDTRKEIWKSDGTEAGTVMVYQLPSPSENTFLTPFAAMNDRLFFVVEGSETESPCKLLRYNPENSETVTIHSSEKISCLTPINDALYFFSTNDEYGKEPWITDGTEEGTRLLKDLIPGESGSNSDWIIEMDGNAFINTYSGSKKIDGQDGFVYIEGGIWKSDGTEEGTIKIFEIDDTSCSNANSVFAESNMMVIGNTLYFSKCVREKAIDEYSGAYPLETYEVLYKSNGMENGTVLIKEECNGGSVSWLPFGDALFFKCPCCNQSPFQVSGELWISHGFEGSDDMIGSSNSSSTFIEAGGRLFFRSGDDPFGCELSVSDGTTFFMVKDIQPGTASGLPYSDDFWEQNWGAEVSGGGREELVFVANDGVHGSELWKSDGTEAGTVMLKDIAGGAASSNITPFISKNGKAMFIAGDENRLLGLWQTDGTEEGTQLIKEVESNTEDANPKYLRTFLDMLYFVANDGYHGYELWKTDGTEAGTVMVKDIKPGASDSDQTLSIYNSSDPNYFKEINNILYFSADDGVAGKELWKTDGTEEGTVLVRDILPGDSGSQPASLIEFAGKLFFQANDGESGYELWESDGTAEGTRRVKDIYAGSMGSSPGFLCKIKDVFVFSAWDEEHGFGLWKCDGTEDGTEILKDMRTDAEDSQPQAMTLYSDTVFFIADDGIHGSELWKTDGTSSGTKIVRDICPGEAGSDIDVVEGFLPYKNGIFFVAGDGTIRSVWVSDGTETGTYSLDTSFVGDPHNLKEVNGHIYFQLVATNEPAVQLWGSDGTREGTFMIRALYPGVDPEYVTEDTPAENTFYFIANNVCPDNRLWQSDGTEAGTFPVNAKYPELQGVLISQYAELVKVNNKLFFSGDSPNRGLELWCLPL